MVIIALATIIVSFLAWINPFDSLFHVISMMSSTGISYIDVAATPVGAKTLLIIVGLIGGCAFSMAGGIRIQRIQMLIDALRKKGENPKQELKAILISIIGFLVILSLLSVAYSTVGISMLDSVFEIGSALTTNGISLYSSAQQAALPLGYKWLLILAMIVGRIEIVIVFKGLFGEKILNSAKLLLGKVTRGKRGKQM
jgi:trk system potassium uptake protein TrkH